MTEKHIITMRDAITLMARGTLQAILNVLRAHPELRGEILAAGQALTEGGATPDFEMIRRIQEIERQIAAEILAERMAKRKADAESTG